MLVCGKYDLHSKSPFQPPILKESILPLPIIVVLPIATFPPPPHQLPVKDRSPLDSFPSGKDSDGGEGFTTEFFLFAGYLLAASLVCWLRRMRVRHQKQMPQASTTKGLMEILSVRYHRIDL